MADLPVKMVAHGAAQPAHDPSGGTPWRPPATQLDPKPGKAAPGDDPFRLGFRYRTSTTAEGREVIEQIPLTAEDLVYPQEGDVVSDGYHHNSGLQPRADSLRRHLEKRGNLLVTSDVTLVLRSDGRNCAPDIAVIEGDIDRSEIERAVNLSQVGGRLIFALEVVSTSEKEIEDKDLKANLKRYAKEKVPDYFTVYPVVERQVKNLVGRRLTQGGYGKIAPDAQGRVYSKELDLYFQVDAVTKELVAVDGKTGQRLLISDEEEAGRKEAEAQRAAAEAQRAAAEAQRAAAEAQRKQEAEARRLAEERAKQAEEHAEQEAEARRLAVAQGIKDLCAVLGLDWGAERSAQVELMSVSQLEALRGRLVQDRSWPESFPDATR